MRISIEALAPKGYQAVLDLNAYVESHVDARVLVLVKLRASIVNGCSFCVDMHSGAGAERGESARRLYAVAAWRDSQLFDARERACAGRAPTTRRCATGAGTCPAW